MTSPSKRALPLAPLARPARRDRPEPAAPRAIDRAWRPTYVVWELTLACDLACRHCGSRAGKARPDELTRGEALDLVRQLGEMGAHEVTLIGGEAYLRDDWLEIAAAVRAHGMRCTMTTGGRSLDATRARALAEAGITSVSVSVDGLEEVHDALRGVRGSYRAALEALANLREAGVRATCNTQISRPSLPQLEALFEVLADAGMKAWQLQITVAMGRAADRPELLLEPYQMHEALTRVHRLSRLAAARGISLWPGNNVGYYGPYEAELRRYATEQHRGSCGAGRTILGIEANGDIKGCPSLPSSSYVGGNVRDHGLAEIWRGTPELRFTRDQTAEDLWGFCRTCYYADECRAGCNWTSHVLLGRRGNNPYCHHRVLELMSEGVRERVVPREAAPNEPFDHGRYEIVLEPWPAEELAAAKALLEEGLAGAR